MGYTVFPNFSTLRRTGNVETLTTRMAVTQEGGEGSAEQRFIRMMYFNFFGRGASDPEVEFQIDNTLRKGWSRPQVAAAFFNTPEFNNGGRFAAGLYVGLLDRNAEYGGWLYQRNALATNIVNPSQLVGEFLGSPEYALRFGTPDNPAFVRLLYRHVLLREATQAEVDFQVSALTSSNTRAQMAAAFLNSGEFRAGTGPRLTAFLLYATLLFRDASSAEFEAARSQTAAGASLLNLIPPIMEGSEFYHQLW